jgi:hypothetical protein
MGSMDGRGGGGNRVHTRRTGGGGRVGKGEGREKGKGGVVGGYG